MSAFLLALFVYGLGVGAGVVLSGVLYTMLAHWRPTPWLTRGKRFIGSKKWSWKRRLITKRWPIDGFPRWTL